MTDQNFIADESSLRRYRTEIPNLIDDLDLSVYDHRLYVHMKRVAGAKKGGTCQQGTRQLARKCKMSVGRVAKSKQSLADLGLIVIAKRETPSGPADDIHIVNLWPYNMRLYSLPRAKRAAYLETIKRSLHERSEAGKRSPGEHSNPPGEPVEGDKVGTKRSPGEHSTRSKRSPGERKKELKKEPNKNISAAGAAGAAASEPKNPKAQRWDAFGDALAAWLFDARDRAGINAVYGRVAPILHGDKKRQRCIGLIAYECERQAVDRDTLDFDALAKAVPVFWADYRKKHPDLELKDAPKVLDAWQAWRGSQIPARRVTPAPSKCPDCHGAKLVDYVVENGQPRRARPGEIVGYTAPCPHCCPPAGEVSHGAAA